MRHFQIAILAALLLPFTSCNGVIAVTDYSFEFSGGWLDDLCFRGENQCPRRKKCLNV